MTIRFNADEVFQMAIRIEENGAAFYRHAAGLQKDKKTADFLNGLAAMEDGHKQIFEGIRTALTEREKTETTFDPHGEAALYLEATIARHPGEGSPQAAASLTGKERLEDILQTAIGLEHKSILFYLGLLDLVPKELGKGKVSGIIEEEKSHVAVLTRELNALRR